MKNPLGYKVFKVIINCLIALLSVSLSVVNTNAYWSYEFDYKSVTVKLSGDSQNQSANITLPEDAYVYYASSDNGNVEYSQEGKNVSINVNNGSASSVPSEVWNDKKYSKEVSASIGPQSSQSFPYLYIYNDGTYSGFLNMAGPAALVSGIPPREKSVTYDYAYRYESTATMILVDGKFYIQWHYPYVDQEYHYSDEDGYSGILEFTGYDKVTFTSLEFDFSTPYYEGQTAEGYATGVFHYEGTVRTPDTRKWRMDYYGTVYAGGYDTVYTTKYEYNVTISYFILKSVWVNDDTPPEASWSLNPAGITNGSVTINLSAFDEGSGLKSIRLPDGTETGSSNVSYTVTENGVYTFIARDYDGNSNNIPVTVSNIDRTISVTHPISIGYTINPNMDVYFSCPDITIINNSATKIAVSVESFRIVPEGSLEINDVPPSKYADWRKLNSLLTKSEMALGLKVRETQESSNGWYSISCREMIYAGDIKSKTLFGVLNPDGAAGNLMFKGYCGIAWDGSYTTRHSLMLIFDCFSG